MKRTKKYRIESSKENAPWLRKVIRGKMERRALSMMK